MTYKDLIKKGSDILESSGAYPQEASMLMLEYAKENNLDLYLNMDKEVDIDFQDKYLKAIERLSKHEPLAYIIGCQPFYGYDFIVDNRVLIPRPETEELVGEVLMNIDEMFMDDDKLSVIDVATGSGAIGLTLALEESKVAITLTDISESALAVARENASKFNIEAEFILSDMLKSVNNKYDVLVANPPYIKNQAILEKSVKDYEPHLALYGGDSGLIYYQEILESASKVLNDKFLIAMEIGYDQGKSILDLANKYFANCKIEIKKDINKKDRILLIKGMK